MKRRGVSEIISTIILILIVSVVGSLLFAYSAGFFQEQQTTVISDNVLATNQAEERFRISAVYWSGAGDVIDVAVYNYGIDDISIDDVYVDGKRVQTYTSGRYEEIRTDKIRRIVFTSPITITGGESYTLNIVSSNGVSRVDNWEAE